MAELDNLRTDPDTITAADIRTAIRSLIKVSGSKKWSLSLEQQGAVTKAEKRLALCDELQARITESRLTPNNWCKRW